MTRGILKGQSAASQRSRAVGLPCGPSLAVWLASMARQAREVFARSCGPARWLGWQAGKIPYLVRLETWKAAGRVPGGALEFKLTH